MFLANISSPPVTVRRIGRRCLTGSLGSAGRSFCNHSIARVNAAEWLKRKRWRHLAVYFGLDSVHTRHGYHPTPAGFAYSARCGARGVAASALSRWRPSSFRSRRRWAALPPTCRRSRRFRRAISPPPMAGRCAPATSSARRPIRRCRWPNRRSGSRPAIAMPEGCDCVVDADLVEQTGPMVQVLAEAIPGQGVRRAGGDIAEGSSVIAAGRRDPRARSADRARGGAGKAATCAVRACASSIFRRRRAMR